MIAGKNDRKIGESAVVEDRYVPVSAMRVRAKGFKVGDEAIVRRVQLMAQHVLDTSTLILDPEGDTYYVSYSLEIYLPRLQYHLGEAVKLCIDAANNRSQATSGQEKSTTVAA